MEHFKLLIVGAGASGIATAARLLESGFTDFRILEAENRIGGRVFSTTLGNIPIELGAEWIHGEKGNIVYELAAKHDLAENGPSKINFNKTTFYDFSGHQINKDLSKALLTAYYEIMSRDKKELSCDDLNDSVGDYFEAEFQKSVDELKKKIKIDDSLYKKFIKALEIWENSIDASHSWYETSLRGNSEYWECEGNIITTWKNNCYNRIFSLLTKNNQLPVDSKIIFNKEVVKIKWNKDCFPNVPKVAVECLDGTLFHSDSLLVTCSLGVLKEKAPDMFIPSLPAKKLKCIQNLGFGTVDKIFVKFKNRWWEDDFHGCGFLWSEEEKKQDSSGWLNGIFGFHPINTTSPVLRGWITAEAAQLMESLPNSEVIEGLNYLFNKFLGSGLDVPLIEKCLTSKWYSSSHFRGSYSCRLLQSERTDVWASDLAESVCDVKGKPVLFFGGEASHDHFYSTVHGAIEAGIREAGKLLQNFQNEEVQNSKHCEVAIVGAGISGLAAAKTFFENGISNIVILEAQSKPGGRIRSIEVGDYFLELGAQWIHGSKNEVFAICQENDLLTSDLSSEGEGLYLRQNGEKIDDDIVSEIDYVIRNILDNCDNYVSRKVNIPRSIGEELLLKFNDYLESCTRDSEERKKVKRELFNWHVKFHLIDNSCSDLFNLSAKAWGFFKFCGGDDYINFKRGYSSLIDTIVNSLPENMIRYESVVERVHWAKDVYQGNGEKTYGAKIVTKDGFTVFSQFVIVTSSLGYLKSNYKSMFWPPLPNYLSEAIESLGFGVMNKIFLIYKEPWWDPQIKGFQLVWPEDVSKEPELDWGRYVTGFDVINKNKPVLLGWVGGEGAKAVETLSEEDVARQATEILRQFTKNEKIPLPDKVIRTTWWCNEFVRGAYSHIPVDCDEAGINCLNLAQPVCSTIYTKTRSYEKPTILFAGEAIHQAHYSTVHGAYESGQDQARVVLGYLQSQGDIL